MTPRGNPKSRLREWFLDWRAILVGAVVSLAHPVLAQDGSELLPENAQAEEYGDGWECRIGFRLDGADRVAIRVPENAHATEVKNGSGWACRRGYELVEGTSCIVIPVPANAFLRTSGQNWECVRGYEPRDGACVAIALPENAHLDWLGNGRECDAGFTLSNKACVLGQ